MYIYTHTYMYICVHMVREHPTMEIPKDIMGEKGVTRHSGKLSHPMSYPHRVFGMAIQGFAQLWGISSIRLFR